MPRDPSARCLKTVSAQGWNGTSPGFRSAAMSARYLAATWYIPESAGLPSAFFGAGAERFGLPSGVRGIPGVGILSHCAGANTARASVATMIRVKRNPHLLLNEMLDVLLILITDEFKQL